MSYFQDRLAISYEDISTLKNFEPAQKNTKSIVPFLSSQLLYFEEVSFEIKMFNNEIEEIDTLIRGYIYRN